MCGVAWPKPPSRVEEAVSIDFDQVNELKKLRPRENVFPPLTGSCSWLRWRSQTGYRTSPERSTSVQETLPAGQPDPLASEGTADFDPSGVASGERQNPHKQVQ